MKNRIIEIITSMTEFERTDLISNYEKKNIWDSFTHIEIIMTLEEELDIFFNEEEVGEIITLEKIVSLIQKKVA